MGRQDDLDNHANQLNPNNDAYWQSRGYAGRPGGGSDDDDWGDEDWELDGWHFYQEPTTAPQGQLESDDAPPAKSHGRKLQALVLAGGAASAGAAAAVMLPLAKRLKDRLGRQTRPS